MRDNEMNLSNTLQAIERKVESGIAYAEYDRKGLPTDSEELAEIAITEYVLQHPEVLAALQEDLEPYFIEAIEDTFEDRKERQSRLETDSRRWAREKSRQIKGMVN